MTDIYLNLVKLRLISMVKFLLLKRLFKSYAHIFVYFQCYIRFFSINLCIFSMLLKFFYQIPCQMVPFQRKLHSASQIFQVFLQTKHQCVHHHLRSQATQTSSLKHQYWLIYLILLSCLLLLSLWISPVFVTLNSIIFGMERFDGVW